MTYIAFGALYTNEDKRMSEKLNTQFGKVGGDRFKTNEYYWSSTKNYWGDGIYCVKFDDTKNDKYEKNKTSSCHVRAVLAFLGAAAAAKRNRFIYPTLHQRKEKSKERTETIHIQLTF